MAFVDSLLVDFQSNAFWTFVGLLGGGGATTLWRLASDWNRRRSIYGRILPLDRRAKKLFIFPTFDSEEIRERELVYRLTFQETVYCLNPINTLLLSLQADPKKIEFRMSGDVHKQAENEDLILVGGPINNLDTAWFLQNYRGKKMHFDRETFELISEFTGRRYKDETSDVDGKKQTTVDFAILALVDSPHALGRKVVLVAGCRGMASFGVFSGIADGTVSALLSQQANFHSHSDFWSVFRVEVDHPKFAPTRVSLVSCAEYNPV